MHLQNLCTFDMSCVRRVPCPCVAAPTPAPATSSKRAWTIWILDDVSGANVLFATLYVRLACLHESVKQLLTARFAQLVLGCQCGWLGRGCISSPQFTA